MAEVIIDLEAEKQEILKRYRSLIKSCKTTLESGDRKLIRKAFELAVESHKNMRRKSGEPYIYHPIAVAQICAEEIGLGTTSIICALLHDTVEDTDVTLDDLENLFGKKVASIVEGLTKISSFKGTSVSLQAENFKKMLLTLSDDVRVILVKLADRLHNMRTMDFMPKEKQLKISSETAFLYAPLAHRLGLYTIKSELEDLSMKYTESDTYKSIANQLAAKKVERTKYIKDFIAPIQETLIKQNIKAEILGRPKSIHSIWNKMRSKGITLDEVYDLFAIRIVLDSKPDQEKADCWKTYSIVTDFYKPNPERLKDWVSTPKSNGYESLHTTVMGPKGRWVEVQIRTQRMNEIAEKGFAAHWKYKESSTESDLDTWIKKIRDTLNNHKESNTSEFLDSVKMNLFTDEVFAFTPQGKLIKLPKGATALDFAFDIHSGIGKQCIGAKVNYKLVPLSYEIKNGDQIEILTSQKQTPKEDWLNIVKTAKAKSRIKSALKEASKKIAEDGKEILERKLKALKIDFHADTVQKIATFFHFNTNLDLYYNIAIGKFDTNKLKDYIAHINNPIEKQPNHDKLESTNIDSFVRNIREANGDTVLLGDDNSVLDYKLASCCNPIPGDDIFGFVTIGEGIKIHTIRCPNAIQLMSNYGYRVLKANWAGISNKSFAAKIRVKGIDRIGFIASVINVISVEFGVNISNLNVNTLDGVLDSIYTLNIQDTQQLTLIIKNIKNIDGILDVHRIEN